MFQFALLLFLYLYFTFAQSDTLGYLCSELAGRPVSCPAPLLAAGPTLATALVLYAVRRLFASRRVSRSVAPVLVAWLSAAVVSHPYASLGWQVGLGVTAVLLVWADLRWTAAASRQPAAHSLWAKFPPRALRFVVLLLYIGLGTAVPDTVHYELRTAAAMRSSQPHRAYRVGEVELAATPRLVAMRSLLLATTQPLGLGDKLLQQPLPPGGSELLLLPADARQSLLLSPDSLTRRLGLSRQPGESATSYFHRCAEASFRRCGAQRPPQLPVDYYLCGLLLDRRLDRFAAEVVRYYPQSVSQSRLPRYYAQALLWYARQRTRPAVLYRDAAVEANLRDYLDYSRTLPPGPQRANLLRSTYGETYWWWYEYGKDGTAQ